MIFDNDLFKSRFLKKVIPVGVMFGMGYIDFASYYCLGYREVYLQHSKGVAVSLWVLLSLFQLVLICYWLALVVIGPGDAPQIQCLNLYGSKEVEGLTPVPKYFFCDEQGYPFWCTSCQSIKVPRTFHLKDKGKCVLKFDHYCVWVGTVIGQRNYGFFLKFVLWYDIYFITLLVYLLRYTRANYERGSHDIDHNYIVLYILSGFWILMLLALLCVHIYYLVFNKTTLDDITVGQQRQYMRWKQRIERKERNKWNERKSRFSPRPPREETGLRFINVENNGTRAVVQFTIRQNPFTFGCKQNWINLWLYRNENKCMPQRDEAAYSTGCLVKSFMVLLVPLIDIAMTKTKTCARDEEACGNEYMEKLNQYERYNERLSEQFVKYIEQEILLNRFKVPVYLQNKETSVTESNSNEESV